ncbi:hypothetical protein EDD86DRAFT_9349 [Gorgonomyces haynaldii]|nr:hypothetical protein EDD86DRAFT_9349 [Gorgonomyces haynaldii]
MANSVFISKLVSHVEDRARRDSQLGDKIFQDNGFMVSLEEEKEVEKAPIVQETPKEPKDAKLKGMMSKHRGKKKPKEEKVESTAELYQDYITEDQLELVEEEVVPKKKKTKKHKPKEVPKEEEEEVVETVFEQVDHEISEPVKPLVEKAAEKIEEKVVEQVFKQDIQQVTVVPQVVVEQKDLVVPAAPVVEQIPIKEPELVVKTMVEPIAEPVAQKAPMEETKPTEIVEERPPDAILTEPVVRITRRDPFNDTTKKPPLLKPAKEQKQKPKIKEMLPRGPRQKKTQDYASHGGTYKMAQDIKSTRTDLDDIIPVFTEAALASATFVWDLLRKVRDPEKANSLPPSLKLVLDMLAQLNPSVSLVILDHPYSTSVIGTRNGHVQSSRQCCH